MSTRDIRTSQPHTACDVCGRTLLRGERAEVYLNGGTRRSVCELCKSRALHEGWVREGTVPAYNDRDSSADRRRSLLSRLRSRRELASGGRDAPKLEDDLDEPAWPDAGSGQPSGPPARDPAPPAAPAVGRARDRAREPRHVRAVPTSVEQKIASAVELFNSSEHRRTVAGVARSLGVPTVSLLPSEERPSVVNAVVSWELCWYRYEVDLSENQPSVRVVGQGYELDELSTEERSPNATTDDHGSLELNV